MHVLNNLGNNEHLYVNPLLKCKFFTEIFIFNLNVNQFARSKGFELVRRLSELNICSISIQFTLNKIC